MWPFAKAEDEERAAAEDTEPSGSYTSILEALQQARAVGTVIDTSATAALETAAGLVARAFSVATVAPAGPRTMALTPTML